tara:strand:- start:45 stop:440 length:396 start_codon:yes stop_codon:yes gene_type:complete
MVRQDIVTGLVNAIERGHTLEQAIQTLLNSGYGRQEVMEAANSITSGMPQTQEQIETIEEQTEQPQQTQESVEIQEESEVEYAPQQEIPRKKTSPVTIVLLIVLLLLLLGGLVAVIIFRENLIQFFQNLFS